MATATKKEKKRKEEAYPWKVGPSSRHTTNLKQSILRLSISMELLLLQSVKVQVDEMTRHRIRGRKFLSSMPSGRGKNNGAFFGATTFSATARPRTTLSRLEWKSFFDISAVFVYKLLYRACIGWMSFCRVPSWRMSWRPFLSCSSSSNKKPGPNHTKLFGSVKETLAVQTTAIFSTLSHRAWCYKTFWHKWSACLIDSGKCSVQFYSLWARAGA